MRKNFGVKPMVYPMPVFIIGTYDEYGTPNAMNAAWGGQWDRGEIYKLLIIFSASSAEIGENRLKVFPSLSMISSNIDWGLTHTPRSPYIA